MTHPPCLRLCPAIRVTLALASRVSRLFNGRDIQSEVLARTLSGRASKHAPTAALPVFLDHPSRRRAREACAALRMRWSFAPPGSGRLAKSPVTVLVFLA